MRFALTVVALSLGACTPDESTPLGRASYTFVEVVTPNAKPNDLVEFGLRNTGSNEACLLPQTLPQIHSPQGVRVFDANGEERDLRGSIIDYSETVRSERLSSRGRWAGMAPVPGLAEGDCVLVEVIYLPCELTTRGEISADRDLTSDQIGIARGVWEFRNSEFERIGDEENCGARSDLG